MSVSPPVQPPGNNDGDRQDSSSPYFPRISGANTVARPSPQHTATEEAFPTVKLQAKMVKQTPLPYQTQEFKPCIVLKKFEPSTRVSESFVTGGPSEDALGEFKKKRTVILHTDRYTCQGQLKIESDSQKIRLAQEGQMLQDARSRMRLREALAHRARHDLHLGGNPIMPDAAGAATDEAQRSSKKRDKRRRRAKNGQPPRQPDRQLQLGFIPEDEAAESASPGRRGQLVSHSSAPSLPAQHLGQQQPHHLRGNGGGSQLQASFVSRSEFEALTALIGGAGDSMATDAEFGCGLEKVKLDGSKVVFNRRSDILAELSRLKAIVLPDFAKDLYVGRGIRLPGTHGLNNPKRTLDVSDPVLDALLSRAQQPTRIVDESGNILIASGAAGHNRKQVFAADVTAKPKTDDEPMEPSHEPQIADRSEAPVEEEKQLLPLPEPFLGLPSDWMRDDAEDAGDDDSSQDRIEQLQLPPAVTAYLLAILSASAHPRARAITWELGRLIGQRAALAGSGQQQQLTDCLRRGLDLFHDVDREVKGSVSSAAFLDILSSMRGLPLEDGESAAIRDLFGLSGDSISKLAFLTVLPFLQDILSRGA